MHPNFTNPDIAYVAERELKEKGVLIKLNWTRWYTNKGPRNKSLIRNGDVVQPWLKNKKTKNTQLDFL
jgi:hypothetical protein